MLYKNTSKIQKKLTIAEVSKSFKQRMMKEQINAAMKLLSQYMDNGVLQLDTNPHKNFPSLLTC